MIQLEIPDIENSVQDLVLSSQRCTLEFNFNGTDKRWRLKLSVEGEVILSGLTIMESGTLVSQYNSSTFLGDIDCIRTGGTKELVGRDNLGIGKPYGLYYFSPLELIDARS